MSAKEVKVLISIPAHNEEKNIGETIDEIRTVLSSFDILVVDDCSTDRTVAVAESKGVTVISLPYNLGIAGARQAGYKFAYGQNYDFVVQLDGDGQHDPRYVPDILKFVQEKKADLCIGSRFLQKDRYQEPFLRRLGIAVIRGLICFLIKNKISDPTSGFRAVNKKVISLYHETYPYEYPEPEEIILLNRSGFVISEVPISMRYRKRGKSFVTLSCALYYMVEVILAIFMAFIRKKRF